jgi:NTE family protein
MKNVLGVALGGGGARGLAHAGILRALRQKKMTGPRLICGTSAGSIFASLYAANLAQEDIENEALEFDWFRDVINLEDTLKQLFDAPGLMSNARLAENINQLVGERGFDDLPVGLAVTATDLRHHRRVVFTSSSLAKRLDRKPLTSFLPEPTSTKPGCETVLIPGFDDLGLAVRASCAVPGVFKPVEIEGMELVDGGVLNQVPVDVARAMGATVVLGVSLGYSYLPSRVRGLIDVYAIASSLSGIHQIRRSLDMAEVGFQIPHIEERSAVQAHQPDLVEIGYQTMVEYLPLVENALRTRPMQRRVRQHVQRCAQRLRRRFL